jgi:N-acetyl-anhydromuramyl-L-alanine amidase AmpD
MKFAVSATALVAVALLATPVLAHDVGRHHGMHRHAAKDVRAAQAKLSELGYDPGQADGIAGKRTHAAVKKFQGDKGLEQTGRLDGRTMAALDVHPGSATSGTR